MNLLDFFNLFDISRFKRKINKIFQKFVFFKYHNKKREVIRNSFVSDKLFKNIFRSLKITEIRRLFFNNRLFAFSNKNEKAKIIGYLNHYCNREIKDYLHYANRIINKEFDIFDITHRFKEKVDWHYSFFNDFSWLMQKSEVMDKRPKNMDIDVKYVWEFNRHQFLIYLGFAYYYTEDEIYAREFKSLVLDWINNNPPLYGINWHSGLEISIRLISWIFTLYFFENSKVINNNKFFKEIFKSMYQHAYYLKYFYTRCSLNHTIGDLFGIYLFSKVFKEFKPIKKWEKRFFKKFKKQIILQTRLDGTNVEQSVNYHRFVLEFFSLFYILNPNSLKREERDLIEKMYDYLLFLIKPDRSYPLIGDSDDGKVLLLTYHKKNSFVDLINLGTIMFQREDLKFISEELSPLSILLFGTKGYEVYNNLKSKKPKNKFRHFKNAGHIIIRDNWSKKGNYLFVDYGIFGDQAAGHSHSSITNIIFSYQGKNIINDSGTYSYNKSWKERNWYRGSKAHNIIVINNKNQAKIKSWFSWENKPKLNRSVSINDVIELTCNYGYEGFLIERKIITNKFLNNLKVKDKIIPLSNLDNDKSCNINYYLHFDKKVELKHFNNNIIINNELKIEISSKERLEISFEKYYYSPNYGFKEECWMLNVHLIKKFNNKKAIEITSKISPINE